MPFNIQTTIARGSMGPSRCSNGVVAYYRVEKFRFIAQNEFHIPSLQNGKSGQRASELYTMFRCKNFKPPIFFNFKDDLL